MKGLKFINLFILFGTILFVLSKIFTGLEFDLTKDNRYTLSEESKNISAKITKPLEVYMLLERDLPSGKIKQFRKEVIRKLKLYQNEQSEIKISNLNPENQNVFSDEEIDKLGVSSVLMSEDRDGTIIQKNIFPYLILKYGDKIQTVELITKKLGENIQNQTTQSLQDFEYKISKAIYLLTEKENKKVAFFHLKKPNSKRQRKTFSFKETLKQNQYSPSEFIFNSDNNINQSLDELSTNSMVIIHGIKSKFPEKAKQLLDQYIMHGGKTMWLLDKAIVNGDSLRSTGQTVAFPNDLEIEDLLFNYGIRQKNLIAMDYLGAPLRISVGNNQYQDFPWPYFPLIYPMKNNPITKNLSPVKMQYASPIEVINANDPIKFPLLISSNFSSFRPSLNLISLTELQGGFKREDFTQSNILLGIGMVGKFNSAYKYRVNDFDKSNFKDSIASNKMVFISDASMIENDLQRGQPLPLGYDKWINQSFGNQDFLLNTLDWLSDGEELINLRGKELLNYPLDKKRINGNRKTIQIFGTVLPSLFILLAGFLIYWIRRKNYTK